MRNKKRIAVGLILLLSVCSSLAADNPLEVRIYPEEIYLQYGKVKEPLTVDDLIHLSFAVSGGEAEAFPGFKREMKELLLEGERELSGFTDPYILGEELLRYLHDAVFTRYDENQSSLVILLSDGRYNCVSSSILYLIFSRNLGLEITGVATVDHTFCTVITESGPVDVETTTIYGFEPGKKKEFTSAFGETGFSYVPPGNYRSRWTVGDRKMISYVLQNRISLHERRKQYRDAVELAVDRYALVGDEETRKDMIKEFVNYAALMNEQGRYIEGLDFLGQVRDSYGYAPQIGEVASILINNRIVALTRQGGFEEAQVFLEEAAQSGLGNESEIKKLQNLIIEKRMVDIVTNNPFEAALSEVEAAFVTGTITDDQYREYIVYLFGKQGEKLASAKKWLDAAAVVAMGMEKGGRDSRLLQAKQAFEHNYAAEKHNEFARLFNSGRHKEAVKLLEEALSMLPESELLRKDYNQIRELLATQ